jgi:hypothetical protein
MIIACLIVIIFVLVSIAELLWQIREILKRDDK